MPANSILATLPPPKPPEPNTGWHKFRDGNAVIVFVHGIFSNSRSCWTAETPGAADVYWPDLLLSDEAFNPYSIFLGGFPTSLDSADTGVDECADELWTRLRSTRPSPMAASEIVFVCHSTGGIVVRTILEREWESFAKKSVGLALMASPSQGSALASAGWFLSGIFQNDLAKALKLSNPSLRQLDRRFRRLIKENRIPGLFGREAYENHFIWKLWKFNIPLRVVPRYSAAVYFDESRLLPGTDHYTTVKPKYLDDTPHVFLRDLLASRPPAPAPTPWAIDHLHWSIRIDHESDAINQMVFRGVYSRTGASTFALPPVQVDFGHLTPFQLVPEQSTPGLTLPRQAEDNNKVQVNVQCPTPPTAASPIDFAIEHYDLNHYPLNLGECRRRPSRTDDGRDYVGKLIQEDVNRFLFQIRFPRGMVFAELPSLEIANADGLQPALTRQFERCMEYIGDLRTATLVIDRPPIPFTYRIIWRVGEVRASPAAALPKDAESRRVRLKKRLLDARADFLDPARASAGLSPFATAVAKSLARFTAAFMALIEQRLQHKPLFAATTLDISVMCPTRDDTELVLVTGINFPVQDAQKIAIAYGNGNAGRAWKQAGTRIYVDKNAASDPKGNTYWTIPGQPRHTFLISIPILDDMHPDTTHAILNLGTWDEWHAEEILTVVDEDFVESLTSCAQSELLKDWIAALP